MANQQIVNSFRVLTCKEQKDYSKEIYRADNSMLRKPWAWQKRVYQKLELHLDAVIDKAENLSLDVRSQKYEVTSLIMGVAEGEHKYGADAFEKYMAKHGDKDKGMASVDFALIKKNGKSR